MPAISTIMDSPTPDGFEKLVEDHQSALKGFILSLVAEPHAADDVLQETNLVIWRKAAEFEMGTNFRAWAFRIAHFQVLSHRQRINRSRLVLDDDLVSRMAAEAEAEEPEELIERKHRLRLCLSRLPERQREMIRRRYLQSEQVASIAGTSGIAANAVSQLLHRGRQNLLRCMTQTASPSETS